MKSYAENLWFHPSELMRAADAILSVAPTRFMDVKMWDCKYIQLYVDQRTKSFIVRKGDGSVLTHEEVYTLFPVLRA